MNSDDKEPLALVVGDIFHDAVSPRDTIYFHPHNCPHLFSNWGPRTPTKPREKVITHHDTLALEKAKRKREARKLKRLNTLGGTNE